MFFNCLSKQELSCEADRQVPLLSLHNKVQQKLVTIHMSTYTTCFFCLMCLMRTCKSCRVFCPFCVSWPLCFFCCEFPAVTVRHGNRRRSFRWQFRRATQLDGNQWQSGRQTQQHGEGWIELCRNYEQTFTWLGLLDTFSFYYTAITTGAVAVTAYWCHNMHIIINYACSLWLLFRTGVCSRRKPTAPQRRTRRSCRLQWWRAGWLMIFHPSPPPGPVAGEPALLILTHT